MMRNPKTHAAVNQYTQASNHAAVAAASPHKLIQMLLDGALGKIAMAKGAMERGDTANKGNYVSWAMSIVDGLRMSLDKDAGGDIATNLDSLYDYINRRLFEANLNNNIEYLEEAAGLLREIKSAWDAIPEQFHYTQADG